MFFTATHNQDIYLAHDLETQYCRSTIIHDILVHSWPSLNAKEKQYILTKWENVGLCHDCDDAICLNMNHKHLLVIALALKANKAIGLEQLISKIANDKRCLSRISNKGGWAQVRKYTRYQGNNYILTCI